MVDGRLRGMEGWGVVRGVARRGGARIRVTLATWVHSAKGERFAWSSHNFIAQVFTPGTVDLVVVTIHLYLNILEECHRRKIGSRCNV